MRILIDIIPARHRKYVYALWALIGLLIGVLAILGVDLGAWPDAYAFVTSALGLVAYANTPTYMVQDAVIETAAITDLTDDERALIEDVRAIEGRDQS